MKIPLKFNAKVVDQIEKNRKQAIENFLGDTTVANLTYLIEKAYHDTDTDKIGISNDRAGEVLDEYLGSGSDKEDLLLDFMEALQETGFLSRKIDVTDMRKALQNKGEEMKATMHKELEKTA